MRTTTLIGAATLACAAPSAACYTGPMPLAFAAQTSHLTSKSREILTYYADARGLDGQGRVKVIFYSPMPPSPSGLTLRRKREKAVLSYLKGKGVRSNEIGLVATKKPMPNWLFKLRQDGPPVASVELTVGCS
jgi:hypothetical protein